VKSGIKTIKNFRTLRIKSIQKAGMEMALSPGPGKY
jgi:hypothetical protein